MSNFTAMFSKDLLNALLSGYLQEISLLTASQQLDLLSLVLEDDDVSIEAEILEDTIQ